MKEIVGKCGYCCSRCPSYKRNIKSERDRARCSDGWKKYHGFRITPPKIRLCDGCQAPDEDNPVRYISCRVRKCALFNGALTCAHCSAYPCQDVAEVGNAVSLADRVKNRLGRSIPEKDHLVFIEPYEGIRHLDKIRSSLHSRNMAKMRPVSLKTRIVEFPDSLPFSPSAKAGFQTLHRILCSLNTVREVPLARKESLNKRRKHLLQILWGFGLRGRFDRKGKFLVLDSQEYRSLKLLSYPLDKVHSYLSAFVEYGIRCELVSKKIEKCLTPTGALKQGNWEVIMSFDLRIGCVDALKALKLFSSELHKSYGQDAFKHFSEADMRFLEAKT